MESANYNQFSSGLDDKILEYLNDMLSVENAVVDRLQSRINECPLSEGKRQLQHHLEETKDQQRRLHQMISNRGGKPTDSKADLTTLEPDPTIMAVKTVIDVAKAVTGKDVGRDTPLDEKRELRKTKEDFGLENIEIISYKVVASICEDLGLKEDASLLNKGLKEEQDMANWILANMPASLKALWPRIREVASTR